MDIAAICCVVNFELFQVSINGAPVWLQSSECECVGAISSHLIVNCCDVTCAEAVKMALSIAVGLAIKTLMFSLNQARGFSVVSRISHSFLLLFLKILSFISLPFCCFFLTLFVILLLFLLFSFFTTLPNLFSCCLFKLPVSSVSLLCCLCSFSSLLSHPPFAFSSVWILSHAPLLIVFLL